MANPYRSCPLACPAAAYHESIANLTPADIYFRRGQTILLERERIKRQTIHSRSLNHRNITE